MKTVPAAGAQGDTVSFARVAELFEQACELADPERDVWLRAQCGNDNALYSEVCSLLEAAEAEQKAEVFREGVTQSSVAGQRFGPWKAVRLLGAGGMGSVLLVERADGEFHQLAALKLVAPHLVGEYFLDRLRAERQILANLNHPNITKLLDGGVSESGSPYLVMEYVENGLPFTEYADRNKLKLRDRLELFLKVCDPVEFAHRNLIVHRDLKPSNILVTESGEPKLLDFGTARLIPSSGESSVTVHQFVTPRYASPETFGRGAVTTQTDVFSLGVILYELLTGAWPFGEPGSISDVFLLIQTNHVQPPAGCVTAEIATARSMSEAALRRALSEDLAAILIKAVQADPAQRYASVAELAADVRAYLQGLPVRARKPSSWYTASRFFRRHWQAVSAITAAVLALAITTAVAVYEAQLARDRYSDLRGLTTSLLFDLKGAINDLPGAVGAQRILVNRVTEIVRKMAHSSGDPNLQFALAESSRQLGELQGDPYVQNLGDPKGALESLERARAIAGSQLQLHSGEPSWLWLNGFIEQNIGEVLFGENQTQRAVNHLEKATRYFDAMASHSKDGPKILDAAAAFGVLGDALGSPGLASLFDSDRAAASYRRAIELDRHVLTLDPGAVRARRGIALFRGKLGDLMRSTDPQGAVAEYRQAVAALKELPLAEQERPAAKRLREVLVIKLAEGLAGTAQWSEAIRTMQEPLAYYESAYTADPNDSRAALDRVTTIGKLYTMLCDQPDVKNALTVSERLIPMWRDLIRREPNTLMYQSELADAELRRSSLLVSSGRYREASPLAQGALDRLGEIAESPKAAPIQMEKAIDWFLHVRPASLRDPNRAVAIAKRYLALQGPGNFDALRAASLAYGAAGQTGEAKRMAELALTQIPPSLRTTKYPELQNLQK